MNWAALPSNTGGPWPKVHGSPRRRDNTRSATSTGHVQVLKAPPSIHSQRTPSAVTLLALICVCGGPLSWTLSPALRLIANAYFLPGSNKPANLPRAVWGKPDEAKSGEDFSVGNVGGSKPIAVHSSLFARQLLSTATPSPIGQPFIFTTPLSVAIGFERITPSVCTSYMSTRNTVTFAMRPPSRQARQLPPACPQAILRPETPRPLISYLIDFMERNGRSGGIRTHDPLSPRQVR